MHLFRAAAFLLFCFLIFSPVQAIAACTSPAGVNSQTRYDFAAHKMFVCNNTDWLEIPSGVSGGIGCVLDNVVVPDGASYNFYNVQNHANCASVMAARACTNGTLGGNATYQYAQCAPLVADTTPDAFSFTDQTGVALNTVRDSNFVQITGINAAATMSFTGTGFYRICSDSTCSSNPSWVNASSGGSITNNQYLQLRVTSSASNNTAVNLAIDIGGVTDTWSVTTESSSDPCVAQGGVGGPGATLCWFLGTAGESCDQTCSAKPTHRHYSEQTVESTPDHLTCGVMLSFVGAPGSGNSTLISNAGGCQVNGTSRRRGSTSVSSTTVSGARRLCACSNSVPPIRVGGAPWILSGLMQSCDTACANYGGCHAARTTAAATNNGSCTTPGNALGATGTASATSGSGAVGCYRDTFGAGTVRRSIDGSPTCSTTGMPVQRVCSCNSF